MPKTSSKKTWPGNRAKTCRREFWAAQDPKSKNLESRCISVGRMQYFIRMVKHRPKPQSKVSDAEYQRFAEQFVALQSLPA